MFFRLLSSGSGRHLGVLDPGHCPSIQVNLTIAPFALVFPAKAKAKDVLWHAVEEGVAVEREAVGRDATVEG